MTKRAYPIYKERGYEAVLLVAALRGTVSPDGARRRRPADVDPPRVIRMLSCRRTIRAKSASSDVRSRADAIDRLRQMPDFVRAYEPDGMTPGDFIGFGATQRTLSQFAEIGWKLMESLP